MKIADSLMCLLSAVFKAIIPKIQKEPQWKVDAFLNQVILLKTTM